MNSVTRWECVSAAVVLAVLVSGCRRTTHITLACEATPPAVYQGGEVIVNAIADPVSTEGNVNVLYNWSGTAVAGNGETARVVTASLAPGTYTVNAEVKEGKPGKEGRKPGESATCTTRFRVKELAPITISCSADPSTVSPGASSRITCRGASPQGRPVTYKYSANAGTIIGIGDVGIFLASDAPNGPVEIISRLEDDENHQASTETVVTIEEPGQPSGLPIATDMPHPIRPE